MNNQNDKFSIILTEVQSVKNLLSVLVEINKSLFRVVAILAFGLLVLAGGKMVLEPTKAIASIIKF